MPYDKASVLYLREIWNGCFMTQVCMTSLGYNLQTCIGGAPLALRELFLCILTMNNCTEEEAGLYFQDSYPRCYLQRQRLDTPLTCEQGRSSVLAEARVAVPGVVRALLTGSCEN